MKTAKWKDFYLAEEALFEYIKANSTALRVDIEPTYIEKEEYKAPPTYVRAIYRLNEGVEEDIRQQIKIIKKLYNIASLKPKNIKFPNRFPILYQNVRQINISKHQAFSSVSLKEDTYFSALKTSNKGDINLLDKTVKDFKNKGIDAVFTNIFGMYTLRINVNDVFKYAGAKKIQARRLSGYQFRALIRTNNDTRGKRINYGFILLDHHSLGDIYESNPQAERPHKLDNIKEIVDFYDLPLTLDYTFYKK